MVKCVACSREMHLISNALGACVGCLKAGNPEAFSVIAETRRRVRENFNLPIETPRDENGVTCNNCVRTCQIAVGGRGFCGIRINRDGILQGGDIKSARVQYYHDPLPTNCVADWVCPAGTNCGYPQFSYSEGAEYGYLNLAVFYQACSFDCLFCQNWHYRQASRPEGGVSAQNLADAVNEKTACICYFGGDPAPQIHHAIEASRIARKTNSDRILRICWETNGSENPHDLEQMIDLSLASGGCIKFDLKAFNPELHRALCGIDNKRTLSNFRKAATYIGKRPEPPLLIASTLLIPGYIDAEEVSQIAHFIAGLNPSIPYSLLAFHPCFVMHDLPQTSRGHAEEAEQAAREAGLTRVRVGNKHLLGDWY